MLKMTWVVTLGVETRYPCSFGMLHTSWVLIEATISPSTLFLQIQTQMYTHIDKCSEVLMVVSSVIFFLCPYQMGKQGFVNNEAK